MGKDKLSNEEKKALGYDLFMNTTKTQNEICQIIKTSPQTFTRWKKDGLWEELKGATTLTGSNIITNIYKKMFEMTQVPDKINADALAKLARVIEVVSEKKYTISQVFNVFQEFTNWLFPKDADLAKAVNKQMKAWVDELINQ